MKKSMIQRLGCLVASISFAFVGATAFADAWFTAKEAGGDLLATGGTWSKDDASWDALTQTYNNFNTPLKFEATESKSNIASITTSVKFTAKDELTEEEIAGAKGGLAVLEAEDGSETNYWGVVSGAWVKLAGAEPDLTQAVTASISLFTVGKDENKKTYINYTIGSTPLTVDGNADILTDVADASIKSVEYLGKCELASLSGEIAAPYVAQGADQKFYKTISDAGNQAVTIVNATSYTPTATTIGSCNISDPDGFLTLNQGSLANVGLKVATVNGQVAIRPNFTSVAGDGTSAATAWEIGSTNDLAALKLGVANNKFGSKGQYFKQTVDIDMNNIAWEGIGIYKKYTPLEGQAYFGGVYDGFGHEIKNLTFPTTGERNQQGLFRKVYSDDCSAEIKNLTVSVNYDASGNAEAGAAAVVGVLSNAKITSVTAKGSIKGGHACSGIAGMINGNSVLTDVTNNVNVVGYVNGNAKAGGICNITQNKSDATDGQNISGTPKFIRCVNNGTIKGRNPTNGIGGLVGYLDTPIEVEDCEMYGSYAKTDDSTESGKVGSIFGIKKTASVTMKGTNKAIATVVAGDASFRGLNFATVSGNIATFVANDALAANGSYTVMAPIAAPAENISLSKGQTIAFDNSLYTPFKADGKIVADDPDSAKITTSGDNPKIYAWASKIVPITPDPSDPIAKDLPSIAVHDDVLKERGIDPDDSTAVTNYLLSTQANGQKGWVNYALGIGDAAGVDNTPVLVDESTEANKIQINLGIDYEIDETSGCSAKIVKEGEEDGVQVSEDGEIILTDETSTEVFKVKFVVTDKAGKEETVVEKSVGIEKKTPENALEIISVPFTDLASDETVSIGNVLKAVNLTVGDKVYVYDAVKGENVAWQLDGNGAWTGDGSVSLKPGDGIWLERKDTSKSVFAFGGFKTAAKSTEVKAGNWAVVANPNLVGEVNLNTAVIGETGDQIVVETGAAPKTFTYENGAWGYNKTVESIRTVGTRSVTVKKVSRVTEESTIPAGAGFWFGNAGESAKTINWSVQGK